MMYPLEKELTKQREQELREQFEEALRIMRETNNNIVYVRRCADPDSIQTAITIGVRGGALSLDRAMQVELGEHCWQEFKTV